MEFEARGKHVRLPAEIRADDDGVRVEGYAAVFDQEADIGGCFRERIARGAFAEAIGRDDVVFLINHDGLPLARTRSGTLTLEEDSHGLKMSSQLDPEDPDVRSIVGKMRRGDLDKMSFAFWPETQEWDETGDVPLRTITKARLHDVSIVTTPAYDGTEIGLRCLAAFRSEQRQQNFSAAQKRRRMKRDLELKLRENGQGAIPAYLQQRSLKG
jgi:HK97 family phage prohead protease